MVDMSSIHAITLPDDAIAVIKTLESARHSAWAVGGCVRDALIGREGNDIDIATSATWREVCALFRGQGMKVYETGTAHGTVSVNTGQRIIEVTTYRVDGPYSDHRHPTSVRFVDDIEEDLARRDFTVNAIAYNPARGILDPFGGQEDIASRMIRTVGAAEDRFDEDALRIMRAVRFSSQLGFRLEEHTSHAAHEMRSELSHVAIERIEHEFSKMLLGDDVCRVVVDDVDIIGQFIPEALPMRGLDQRTKYHVYDVLEHTAHVVAAAPKRRIVRYAAFFHDIGKPTVFVVDDQGVGHSPHHASASAEICRTVLGRMRLRSSDVKDITTLVSMHQDTIEASPRAVKRVLNKLDGNVALFRDLLDLKRADAEGHAPGFRERARQADEVEEVLDQVLAENAAFCIRDLAVDGNDALACGITPGPGVGAALEAALDMVIDGAVDNDRDELMAFLSDRANSTQ
jgi:tRNA nucleotidyltransferase (CCA-adding enzyme)